jgi:hypothetical protein
MPKVGPFELPVIRVPGYLNDAPRCGSVKGNEAGRHSKFGGCRLQRKNAVALRMQRHPGYRLRDRSAGDLRRFWRCVVSTGFSPEQD